MSALCGCFAAQKHKSEPVAKEKGRSSWASANQYPQNEKQIPVKKRPKPVPKPKPRYILRQNTLNQYLDVMFFTPETGGEDIVDEATYLPDVTKKLVLIIPWVTPRDDVLMEYCMLYLNYSTDVMIVRYGIRDLLDMPRMREMSNELGSLLKRYCPSYSAVVCHSIQGGTFIMCDLLSRNFLVNISALIVERLACDWINLPLDGLIKHSNSFMKRLSFRQEHELSTDLRDALYDDDNEGDDFEGNDFCDSKTRFTDDQHAKSHHKTEDIYAMKGKRDEDTYRPNDPVLENHYHRNRENTYKINQQMTEDPYARNHQRGENHFSFSHRNQEDAYTISNRRNTYNMTHQRVDDDPYAVRQRRIEDPYASNHRKAENPYSISQRNPENTYPKNTGTVYQSHANYRNLEEFSTINQRKTDESPYFENFSATAPKQLSYATNQHHHQHQNQYQQNPRQENARPAGSNYQSDLRRTQTAGQRPNGNGQDVVYRHSISAAATNNARNRRSTEDGKPPLQYHKPMQPPQRAATQYDHRNGANHAFSQGHDLNKNGVLKQHSNSGGWIHQQVGLSGVGIQPSLSLYSHQRSMENYLGAQEASAIPGNNMNFYGTLNSRHSLQSSQYQGHYGSNQGHYGSNPGHYGSNQGHYGSSPGQLFRQHSQSFMEHSSTAMNSFSTIIPHLRVPVLIFATGKDNCDVDGIKSMINNWRFQGVKVTLRYWKKCSGVSLLESHNNAFMKTLDAFLDCYNLSMRS